MQHSTDRILTTHTGSLPRPLDLAAMLEMLDSGIAPDPEIFNARTQHAVAEIVRQQVEAGVDIINDGEQSSVTGVTAAVLPRPMRIPESGITTGPRPRNWPVCTGSVTYIGHDAFQSDIANFKAALAAAGIDEGFMTAVAPGSAARVGNAYYATDNTMATFTLQEACP